MLNVYLFYLFPAPAIVSTIHPTLSYQQPAHPAVGRDFPDLPVPTSTMYVTAVLITHCVFDNEFFSTAEPTYLHLELVR